MLDPVAERPKDHVGIVGEGVAGAGGEPAAVPVLGFVWLCWLVEFWRGWGWGVCMHVCMKTPPPFGLSIHPFNPRTSNVWGRSQWYSVT